MPAVLQPIIFGTLASIGERRGYRAGHFEGAS
jgi:hypothetical protein